MSNVHAAKVSNDVKPELQIQDVTLVKQTNEDDKEEGEEEEDEEPTDHYTGKVWGKDDSPDGYTMTGKSVEFQKAIDQIKSTLKKGSKLYVDNMIVEVKDVAVKGPNHIEAVIDVVQKKVKGSIKLTYWGKKQENKAA